MSLVKVKGKYQVTIPTEVRKTLGIEEGDLLEVEARGGEIIFKPKALVDKRQLELVQEGIDAHENGDVSEAFDDMAELAAYLKT